MLFKYTKKEVISLDRNLREGIKSKLKQNHGQAIKKQYKRNFVIINNN